MKHSSSQGGWVHIVVLVFFALAFIGWCGEKCERSKRREAVRQQEIEIAEKTEKATDNAVNFMKNLAPEVYRKISEIDREITINEKKLRSLYNLREEVPDQAWKIDPVITKWSAALNSLEQTKGDIEKKLRESYVEIKIDEIKGKKSFASIESKLIEKATGALKEAEDVKRSIEAITQSRE